jgi:hypothetical protein
MSAPEHRLGARYSRWVLAGRELPQSGTSGAVMTDESRLRRPQPPGMNVQPVGQLPFGQPTCHQGPSR